jgi:hypothetical protein
MVKSEIASITSTAMMRPFWFEKSTFLASWQCRKIRGDIRHVIHLEQVTTFQFMITAAGIEPTCNDVTPYPECGENKPKRQNAAKNKSALTRCRTKRWKNYSVHVQVNSRKNEHCSDSRDQARNDGRGEKTLRHTILSQPLFQFITSPLNLSSAIDLSIAANTPTVFN